MKAVFIEEHGGPEKLIYGDRPEPEAAPGEIMLRVRASALNHLDLPLRTGAYYRGPLPRILGCDIAGEVVTVSPAASTSLQPGDRVIFNNRIPCRTCEHCRMGNDQWCADQKRLGVDLDGGHAEYITAPAANAHVIPEWMDFTEAAAPAHRCPHGLALHGDPGASQAVGTTSSYRRLAAASAAWPYKLPKWWERGSSPPLVASGSWTRRKSGAPMRASTTARLPTSATGSRSSPTDGASIWSSTASGPMSGSRTYCR